MNDRLISVVIPSYNYAKYLPQAAASVFFQSYPNIELVIVDDASTDQSPELIEQIAEGWQQDGRCAQTIFNTQNKGAHAAINKGIDAARGSLVAILNADDLYQPERFDIMTRHMDGARMAFSAVRCIDGESRPSGKEQAAEFEDVQRLIDGKRFMALSAVAENVAVSTGNLLFEKSLWQRLGGFRNYKYVHDYDFFLRACLAAEPVYVPQTAYLYRLHGQNSFTRLKKEGRRENRILWLDIYAAVQKGNVQNPLILKNPDYREEFLQAVCAAGPKKEKLWKMARNPLISAAKNILKKRYGIK